MTSENNKQDQLLALAALFQCCQLVDSLARNGSAAEDQIEPLISSLFVQDPENTRDVYANTTQLQPGMAMLRDVLSMNKTQQHTHILRYAICVLQITQKLRSNKVMLQTIGKRLVEINRQREHFSTLHCNVISSLAELYLQTISTFRIRIQVNGYAQNLQQTQVAEKIRVLLFAGIRAAMLWYQLGGKRWQLILNRKALLRAMPAEV